LEIVLRLNRGITTKKATTSKGVLGSSLGDSDLFISAINFVRISKLDAKHREIQNCRRFSSANYINITQTNRDQHKVTQLKIFRTKPNNHTLIYVPKRNYLK
jgi:hypothetical protein